MLADIIASDLIPVVRLTEVFRQAAGSRVITNAHRINGGQMPELSDRRALSDFYFIDAEAREDAGAKIVAAVRDRIPKAFGLDATRDVQVLCPMNRGGLDARSLNIELQKALNPPGEARVERFGWTFGRGDKVMQVENDYDRAVYNGDLGIVQRIDQEEGELVVAFDGREVGYGFDELYTGGLWSAGCPEVFTADARSLIVALFAVGFRWTSRPQRAGRGLWHPELQAGVDVISRTPRQLPELPNVLTVALDLGVAGPADRKLVSLKVAGIEDLIVEEVACMGSWGAVGARSPFRTRVRV